MSSLEVYVMRVKPAIDSFLKEPSKKTLKQVELEIKDFDFGPRMPIFQLQILVPLVIKLDDLSGESQELRTSLLECLSHIVSKLYLSDEKGLRSILVVVLKQIRDSNSTNIQPNLSEEIKLAAVHCITAALQRSTSDVLEAFYTKATAIIIGQILLTLVELIAQEKYRKLVIAAIQCLMVVFYVHDGADACDVVLRNQVANTIFIFLPKVITVLFKTALADDKIGETIKSTSIKALGRITCIMFEETTDDFLKSRYDLQSFQALLNAVQVDAEHQSDSILLGSTKPTTAQLDERLEKMQTELRSAQWIAATSQRLRPIFVETGVLRAHSAVTVRHACAEMCCLLLKHCTHNLKHNFIHILEGVLALSEDEEPAIAQSCQRTLSALQQMPSCAGIFDENAELLLDAHLNKWPRILHRGDDNEQFAELLFFKGFLRNVNADKLQLLLLVPKNLEMFVTCLLAALDLRITRDLLNEEYSLRCILHGNAKDLVKLPWRQFKHLSTKRSVDVLYDIASLLGEETAINRLIFDYCLELIERRNATMNEAFLLLTLMVTPQQRKARESRLVLVELLLEQLLSDEHWHLAVQPDAMWRLKINKPTAWFENRTPGLFESAVEVRTQDCDSDDDDESEQVMNRVSILDAQFNVLHICLVLDALGHCARFIGDTFDRHIFGSLHKVLLKLANSNTIIHQAATFAFTSMQLALKYAEPSHFIECSTDYITYHLNALLKRSPQSSGAVDILTVVLQYSTRGNVPHLNSIFQTIREECTKSYQIDNVHSYLRVFHAFLRHVAKWQSQSTAEIDKEKALPMQVDMEQANVLSTWLAVLNNTRLPDAPIASDSDHMPDTGTSLNDTANDDNEDDEEPASKLNVDLPRHIEMTKDILNDIVKFVSGAEQTQQILALECLATGLPLLADYENELLPLVHLIWQPLVEKFRQKDAIVLHRCFDLLQLLGLHSKDFILKRSLSDVIPQLKEFLKVAATHSSVECSVAQTQEYKLQLKLLLHLPQFIQSVQLEGKHLQELLSIVAQYLAQAQPKELQSLAVQFYQKLSTYNGPFVYVTLLQHAHLKAYKANVAEILGSMGFTI